jgi:hypothetical protein
VLALLVMVNYLAARHFKRWSISEKAQTQLSPLTQRVLNAVTNPVRVTLYYDKRESLYSLSYNLLKAYRYANPLIDLQIVDYINEPGAAQVVKLKHKLGETDRDLIIFESQDRPKIVYQGELSDVDLQPLMRGESKEIKRTNFKGEALFTSAILSVISARPPKAYFLDGHGEHSPESEEGQSGYSRFAGVLRENNVQPGRIRLEGPVEIPADCNLLIIPGPQTAISQETLDKIGRYLKQGGRLFVMFVSTVGTKQPSGLETLLAEWGVTVGNDVVTRSATSSPAPLGVIPSSNRFSTVSSSTPFCPGLLTQVAPQALMPRRSIDSFTAAPPDASSRTFGRMVRWPPLHATSLATSPLWLPWRRAASAMSAPTAAPPASS